MQDNILVVLSWRARIIKRKECFLSVYLLLRMFNADNFKTSFPNAGTKQVENED